jgi:hypothetical protein
MKNFTNKLETLHVVELMAMKREYQDLTASSAGECDKLYDRLHCITVELIDRAVRKIPNAEKYAYNWKSGEIEVFFSPTQSQVYSIKELVGG